jgi:hypothetical protein
MTDSNFDSSKVHGDHYDEIISYMETLAEELNCSTACAQDVWYLRQRSRWTQELEDKLILLYREGNPPNINEFE